MRRTETTRQAGHSRHRYALFTNTHSYAESLTEIVDTLCAQARSEQVKGEVIGRTDTWQFLIVLNPDDRAAIVRHLVHPALPRELTVEMDSLHSVPSELSRAVLRFAGRWHGRHWAEHPPGRRRARGHARLWEFYLRALKKRSERWAALLTERDERAQQSLERAADLLRDRNWSATVYGPNEAADQSTPSHHSIANAENGAELARAVLQFTRTFDPDRPIGPGR